MYKIGKNVLIALAVAALCLISFCIYLETAALKMKRQQFVKL